MAQTLHAVKELRNRFLYDQRTGELRWAAVDFPTWSRGKPRPSLARYKSWLREFAGSPVRTLTRGGVLFVLYRKRAYALARLLWALKTGEHPPEDRVVVFRNGDASDWRSQNLELLTLSGLRRKRAERRRSGQAPSRLNIPPIELLETWLWYEDGTVYYQDVSLEDFLKRYRAAGLAEYQQWLEAFSDTPLPESRSRKAPARVRFGSRLLPKAELVFALCRGFVLPEGVLLTHIDGDWRNCRIENLRVEYPKRFGDDDEDVLCESAG